MRIIDLFSGARQVVYEAWFDIDGAPMMMDGDVYYGVRKEYDENGRVNYETYIDAAGELMPNVDGAYQVAYDYDEEGNLVRERWFDGSGAPLEEAV